MFSNIGGALERFKAKADILNREDMFVLSCKKIGTVQGDDNIYLIKYSFGTPLPTKIQIQSRLNKDFGQLVVLDPTQVRVGAKSIIIKAYSQYGLNEISSPVKYISGITQAMAEDPKDFLVETGDTVRFFNGTTMEGQVIGFQGSNFSIRVGTDVVHVAGDSVIDVVAAEKFEPVDKAAYEYFLKIYPKDFTKNLCNMNPDKVENKPTEPRPVK